MTLRGSRSHVPSQDLTHEGSSPRACALGGTHPLPAPRCPSCPLLSPPAARPPLPIAGHAGRGCCHRGRDTAQQPSGRPVPFPTHALGLLGPSVPKRSGRVCCFASVRSLRGWHWPQSGGSSRGCSGRTCVPRALSPSASECGCVCRQDEYGDDKGHRSHGGSWSGVTGVFIRRDGDTDAQRDDHVGTQGEGRPHAQEGGCGENRPPTPGARAPASRLGTGSVCGFGHPPVVLVAAAGADTEPHPPPPPAAIPGRAALGLEAHYVFLFLAALIIVSLHISYSNPSTCITLCLPTTFPRSMTVPIL